MASASWLQLHGLLQAYQAAVLREDDAEAQRIRQQAHDMLDTTLDLNGQAAVETRTFIEG